MNPARSLLAVILLTPAVLVKPQTLDDTRAINALGDLTWAQEQQADELRRIQQIESDHAQDEGRARHNAERDSRSAQRFDWP